MKKQNQMAAIAVEKSLLKEYQTSTCDRTVYLDKDSEFQIKLFNPTTGTIGADIFVNGESLGKSIILRPGEIIWLERFLDKAKKFRFDVYEVDKGQSGVREAIEKNGEVKVMFYKEYKSSYSSGISYPWNYGNVELNHVYNIRGDVSNANPMTFMDNSICQLTTSCIDNGTTITSSTYSTDTYETSNDFSKILPTKIRKRSTSSTDETGRISEGSYSAQNFKSVGFDSEILPFETETIKILPKSQKPFTKNDLEKVYCHECGRKIKSKFKYCPFCGAKQ